jgi:transposase-like protein
MLARNPIQFQKGMSLGEFQARFGSDEQCRQAVLRWRWPEGFRCPKCGGRDHAVVGQRRLYLCHGCRWQTSLTAGTIFAHSLLPLTKWFQAMWLLTQSKNSIATLELARQIGVKWDSAWLMRQKLSCVMAEAEATRRLDGRIEIDDAVLGGEKSEHDGGKRGRAGPNKVPFVIAVETTDDDRPRLLLLQVVAGHDGKAVAAMAKAHLEPTARVVSDGLGCFRAVTQAGCSHAPIVAWREPQQPEKIPALRWVNTVLGNLTTAIVGTHKSIRRHYVFRTLAQFQFRFNGRCDLPALFVRLATGAASALPKPYAAVRVAYAGG